jgi:uncharacterized protein involved in response to NO
MNSPSQNYFLSQPHQPFFLFGVFWSVISVLLFGLSYKGVISSDMMPQAFHSYSLIFIVFTQFFIGFLFTTFARFCQSDGIEKSYYVKVFILFQSGALLFFIGNFLHVNLLFGGSTLIFIANTMVVYRLYIIYKTGQLSQANSDPFWILTGFFVSLLSHLLFLIYIATDNTLFYMVAVQVGFYNYLIFLAFAVGQRMIPFFSHYMGEKINYFTATVFFLLLAKSICDLMGFYYVEIILDFGLALYLLKEILRWKLQPLQSPAILWVLHLALLWLPVALFIGALATLAEVLNGSSFAAMQIHLLSIGFLTTVLIGFGTRVTLGHSGQPPHADRFTTTIFWLIQIIVLFRALYSLQLGLGLDLFWLFDASMTLWILLFVVWAWRFAPVLYFGKKLNS